uniref:Uncharacterized protein n=5 Tax=Bacilli TaxID=91061 RepID=I6QPI4_STAAU|nr:unknown [Enterococcus faecalis]AFM38047.1 hypothetical protein [Staphylococcus aureus]AHH31490.1 hypothetical protein [Streptococcus agalactiae]QHI00429.1 hypothetical protein [Streptococcus suis]QJS07108.1 hypothetical protein [Enterococcus faecium]
MDALFKSIFDCTCKDINRFIKNLTAKNWVFVNYNPVRWETIKESLRIQFPKVNLNFHSFDLTLFFIWVTSGIRYIEASSEQHLNDIDEFNINRNGLIGAFTTRLRPNFTV